MNTTGHTDKCRHDEDQWVHDSMPAQHNTKQDSKECGQPVEDAAFDEVLDLAVFEPADSSKPPEKDE